MTIKYSNVEITDTFSTWVTRTNQLIESLNTYVVTTNSNTAIGNASISGRFQTDTLYTNSITGGEFGNTTQLEFYSDVNFNDNVYVSNNQVLTTTSNLNANNITTGLIANTLLYGTYNINVTEFNGSNANSYLFLNNSQGSYQVLNGGLHFESAGHISDNGQDAGLYIKSFSPCVAFIDKSLNSKSALIKYDVNEFQILESNTSNESIGSNSDVNIEFLIRASNNILKYKSNDILHTGLTINADTLNSQSASFYQNANNLTTGTIPTARLTGTYNISITGTANTANTANNSIYLNSQPASAYVRNNLPLVLDGHQKINGGINVYAGGNLSGDRKDYGILVESYEPTVVLQDLSTNAGALALHFNYSTFNIFYKNTNDGTISKGDMSLFSLAEGHCRYRGQDMYHAGSRATQAEAEAGTSSTTIMTPQRTRQAIDSRSIGYNQTWHAVTASRSSGVAYQNTTNKPIMIHIQTFENGNSFEVSHDGTTWVRVNGGTSYQRYISLIIPSGHFYKLLGGSIVYWTELR